MLLYVLIFLISALLLIYQYKITTYWKKRNVKQEFGTLWEFSFGKKSLPEVYKRVYDENDTAIGSYLGAKPVLIIKDLEDVQAIFAGDFHSFHSRGILISPNDTLAQNLLFLSDFNKWKCLRQKLSPLFTSAKLKNMFYIMDKCARDFVDLLEVDVDLRRRSFDALSIYTTSAIGAAVFGIDTKTKNTMDSPFIEMARKSIQPSLRGNTIFAIGNFFPFLVTKLNLALFTEHEEFFIAFFKKVLNSRRNDPIKRHDFIDLCVELQNQGLMHEPSINYTLEPTDEVLAAQAFFFFLAGVDTSASTLNFVLLELSSHPDILAKVHDEIDSIFENGKEELTYNDVEKLQYLDMVVSEAIRKYPSIGLIQRECTRTTVLPASKIKIEKGAGVVVPVFAIHRDEKYFPEPDKFDPERFSNENSSQLHKFSYLPFGEGNRVCIGARFARLQGKAALAWMLRRFTLAKQDYNPKLFEKSAFAIRDSDAKFELIPRKSK